MQFNYHHNIGQNIVHVEFLTPQRSDYWDSFTDTLERIGGKCQILLKDWTFPSFITSQVISEVIRNTCFVCGGQMKDSTALRNPDAYSEPDEVGKRTIYSGIGHAQQITVRKCTQCGHSHT